MMYKLENEKELLKSASEGDGSALTTISNHIKTWVEEAGELHAKIEVNRLSIQALGVMKTETANDLALYMQETILNSR